VFQYRETIFINPVVQYHPQEVSYTETSSFWAALRFQEKFGLKKPKVNPRFWESGRAAQLPASHATDGTWHGSQL
jgi:hypothetical protein